MPDTNSLTLSQRRQLLVEALESGLYTQAQRHLRDTSGYCCLGVACEVYQKWVGDLDASKMESPVSGTVYFYSGCFEHLPAQVMKWYGFTTGYGNYGGDNSLARDNDKGQTFTEIAATIRSNPEGLFKENEE